MKTTKRIDCHRPGAIIPADYSYVLSYRTPGSEPFDTYGMKEARETCEAIGWGRDGSMFGHIGKCGVCGARYREGDIWRHEPTGHLLHIGHDCADKYEMLADREDFDAAVESIARQRAAVIQGKVNAERRAEQANANPGLLEAFACGHYIVQDIKRKFEGSNFGISDNQIALVLKIAREEKEKATRPAEANVPAPTGRQVIRGILVSKKTYEGFYGNSIKGTIKVTTPGGVWLAWGTLPESLWHREVNGVDTLGAVYSTVRVGPEVGDEIELTGTLTASSDKPHFAFFKRPSNGKIVQKNPKNQPDDDVGQVETKSAL